jgi:N-acyl-D-aspartate/D-glutamate deacylase
MDQLETAGIKCIDACKKSGCTLPLSSKGSFGAHPTVFCISADDEMMVLMEMENDIYRARVVSLTQIVEKTSNNVAEAYRIKERGYIMEGYYADLVLVDLNMATTVNEKIYYINAACLLYSARPFIAL